MPTFENRHLFHANAVAFGAHIRRRRDFYIPATASSCLPATGGVGTAEGRGEHCNEMISFTHASTRVFGDYRDPKEAVEYTHGNYGENTLATITQTEASISGLRIKVGGRTFHAEFLQARMDNLSDTEGPTRFHHLSTTFHRLSVDGARFTVRTHCDVLERLDTRTKLYDAYHNDESFHESYGRCIATPAPHWPSVVGIRPRLPKSGPILGTVVTGIDWEDQPHRDDEIEGNRIKIKNFGSIHFGEILVEANHRRLTLLRFQLGCPDGGECAAVDISANGTRIPPRVDGGDQE